LPNNSVTLQLHGSRATRFDEVTNLGKVNFTAARIEACCCPIGKSQSFLWDSNTPGLGLRVTANGAKAYIFQTKVHGSTVRLTIGNPRSWGIADAQKEARRLQILVDKGEDPRDDKAKQRAAYDAEQAAKVRNSVTVADAWSEYLEYLSTRLSPKTKKPRSANYLRDHIALGTAGGEPAKRGGKITVPGPLWPLMALKLSDLSANVVAAWLESETPARPTSAAYAYRMLRAFVRWCEEQERYAGIISTDCVTARMVKGAVPSSGTKDGDSLQREQLAAWFSAVRSLSNPVQSAYLQGLLITGARREELAALKWTDVDFQWRSLRISDKVETVKGRVIPLTPYLASLLLELKRLNDTSPDIHALARLAAVGKKWEPSEWVFASKAAADGKIAEPRYAHNQALKAAGLPHTSLHGLRRSFGTLAEWCEAPTGVIAQIQGHKPSAIVEKHYKRRPLDLLRMWHDKIETWMLKEAGIEYVEHDVQMSAYAEK
jgi:integrase